MLIGDRCTVCNETVPAEDQTVCDSCGDALHEECTEYTQTFACPKCGDEPDIGALDF